MVTTKRNIYKQSFIKVNMKRLREIKKYGGSVIIQLTPSDQKDLELKIGDEVDISDLVAHQKKKKK